MALAVWNVVTAGAQPLPAAGGTERPNMPLGLGLFLGGGLLVVGGTQRHWQLYSTDARPRVIAASGAPTTGRRRFLDERPPRFALLMNFDSEGAGIPLRVER